MHSKSIIVAVLGLGCTFGVPSTAFSADRNTGNPNGCKVVERREGAPPAGSVSSSITAGGGHVSGHTSAGNSVTVYSGNGGSVATAGTAGADGSTVVTTNDGNCTLYVNPGDGKESEK